MIMIGWLVLNVGHSIKSIKKNLENFDKKEGEPFKSLKESMGRFLKKMFREACISPEIRMERYKNVGYHYIENYTSSIHKTLKRHKQYNGQNKTYFIEKIYKLILVP